MRFEGGAPKAAVVPIWVYNVQWTVYQSKDGPVIFTAQGFFIDVWREIAACCSRSLATRQQVLPRLEKLQCEPKGKEIVLLDCHLSSS